MPACTPVTCRGVSRRRVASRLVCGLLRRQSLHQQPPDFGNRLTRVQVLRAGLRTVENRVTAIEPKRIFDFVKPFAGCLVAAVQDPAMRVQESGRPKKPGAVPPVARASRGTAGTENTLVQAV